MSDHPDFQARKVEKTLELLGADPRTKELAEMMPALMPMVAGLAGTKLPEDGRPESSELAEVFQAIYDAWSAAEVTVQDEDFREASLATGGIPASPDRS